MVRISVLNDALNSIVNAERKGKRQVLVRPSSKVVIKFLSVMQKHGKFQPSPRTHSFPIPSPIALGQHLDISRVDIMQSWTAAPGIGRRTRRKSIGRTQRQKRGRAGGGLRSYN
ncbi:hypothetical protein L1887_62059 [Cichorium endivia]|nr:hypothetical protein L1887_62059 [Cichorium endivia]